MKAFLISSLILLALALVFVVLVFLYVNFSLEPANTTVAPESATSSESSTAATATSETDLDTQQEEASSTPSVPREGVPLDSLALTEGQREAIALVGIDVETFVITPEMQVCAEEALGAERLNEIIAGAAPTFMETTRLLPCLSVD